MRHYLSLEEKVQVTTNLINQAEGQIIDCEHICPAVMDAQKTFHLDLDKEFDLGVTIGYAKVANKHGTHNPFAIRFYERNEIDDPTSSIFSTSSRPLVIAKSHSVYEYEEDVLYFGSQEVQLNEKVLILITSKQERVCFAVYARFGSVVREFCSSPISLKVVPANE